MSLFPEGFDFYQDGRVERHAGDLWKLTPIPWSWTLSNSDPGELILGIRLHGLESLENAWFFAVFDRIFDDSVFMEITNILASKIATELGNAMPTPPKVISPKAMARVLPAHATHIPYRFFHRGKTLVFDTYFMPIPGRE